MIIPYQTTSGMECFIMPAQPIHKNWVIATCYDSYLHKHKTLNLKYADTLIKKLLGAYPTLVLESDSNPTKESSIGWVCGDKSNLVYVYINPVFRQMGCATDLLNILILSQEVDVHLSTPNGKLLLSSFSKLHNDIKITYK